MRWQKNSGTTQEEVVQNRFTAYVKQSVFHCKSNYLLHQSKQQHQETSWDGLEDILPDPRNQLHSYAELDALRRALQQLREKERKIILSRLMEDKSFVEIAMEMHMSYKTVTCLYYRVIKKLRQYLE